MTDARVERCLQPGLSILVGTVDPHGVPSCCRGITIASADGLETLTVYVPMATSHDALRHVATTKRIAVAASHPVDHCTTQMKGTAIEARMARDDEADLVRSGFDAFAEVLERIGLPRRVTRTVAYWPAFAITMRVEQVFEQTPGPQAGSRIR